jgi:hypothetical protein
MQQTAGENFKMSNLVCNFLKYNCDDEIKNVENAERVEDIGTKRNVCSLLWRNLNNSGYSECNITLDIFLTPANNFKHVRTLPNHLSNKKNRIIRARFYKINSVHESS